MLYFLTCVKAGTIRDMLLLYLCTDRHVKERHVLVIMTFYEAKNNPRKHKQNGKNELKLASVTKIWMSFKFNENFWPSHRYHFCTFQDNSIVPWATFCNDHCLKIEMGGKRNFHRLSTAMEQTLVKWAPVFLIMKLILAIIFSVLKTYIFGIAVVWKTYA